MNFERLADTLKALADPTRLKVIALLNIQIGMFASLAEAGISLNHLPEMTNELNDLNEKGLPA
ncbi:helix-turn-helix transcriptional regulator [Alicyclobacillus suci]|uniref:helix-turn-helix transcriptional regulator n=1 Tax=Alicyclobacillus suci TaxID=2816080 RepID=UPI0011BE4848|nr:helix-turn-helix transcriptional regulator [Alicyclobacillus suci]